MTVSSTDIRISYAGNGVTTAFSYPYYFLSSDDLKVYTRDASEIETLLTLGSNYTVSGAGNGGGGTITMLTAPATGITLTIFRDPAITQTTDYVDGDPFGAATSENALDKRTMVEQRLADLSLRSLKLHETDSIGSGTFNADGQRITNASAGLVAGDVVTLDQISTLTAQTAVELFATRAVAVAATISGGTTWLQTQGYATVGDNGGALYKKILVSTPGGFQSADGAWWQNVDTNPNVKQFGAVGNGIADDTAAIQLAISAMTSGQELDFPVGTYLCNSQIVPGATMPYGIKFYGLGGPGGNGGPDGPVHIKYTGTNICWDIQEALGTSAVGQWEWVNFSFEATQGAGGMFNFNDTTVVPTDSPATQNYIEKVAFRGCKFWGAGAAGAAQTGNAIQGVKMFETLIDDQCFFTNWKRAVWLIGCDNNHIFGRYGGTGEQNVRHIMLEGAGTFGNNNLIEANFIGGGPLNGAETSYGIYIAGTLATHILHPFFEAHASPGQLYLDGVATVVTTPFIGLLDPVAPNDVIIRLGPNMRMNTIINLGTTNAVGQRIVDEGAASYSWESNHENYGLLIINPAERALQSLDGLVTPRIRLLGHVYSDPSGSHATEQKLNLESGSRGLIVPVRTVTAFEYDKLAATQIGLAETMPVVDVDARNGYAIQLSTTNLSGAAIDLVVGIDLKAGDVLLFTGRYKTIGARGSGTTRWVSMKNGVNLGNEAVTDSATYAFWYEFINTSGFADGDIVSAGFANLSSDIVANVEYLQLEVLNSNRIGNIDAGISPDQGNNSITIFPHYGSIGIPWTVYKFNTALSAGRTVTLRTDLPGVNSPVIRILRTANATGAFNLDIGTGPLVSLTAVKQWADVAFDGTANVWNLVGYGTLP